MATKMTTPFIVHDHVERILVAWQYQRGMPRLSELDLPLDLSYFRWDVVMDREPYVRDVRVWTIFEDHMYERIPFRIPTGIDDRIQWLTGTWDHLSQQKYDDEIVQRAVEIANLISPQTWMLFHKTVALIRSQQGMWP
jgi:hypothetical protein